MKHQEVATDVVRLREQRGQEVRELKLQRSVRRLVEGRRVERERGLVRERSDARIDVEAAGTGDPAARVGVRTPIAVDQHVLRGVRAVPAGDDRDRRYADGRDRVRTAWARAAPGKDRPNEGDESGRGERAEG